MKLILKFFVKDKIKTRLVMSPAKLNDWGLYQDARYIYTEEGQFEKRFCQDIKEIWLEDVAED